MKVAILATVTGLIFLAAQSASGISGGASQAAWGLKGPDDDPDVEASNPFVDVTATEQAPPGETGSAVADGPRSPWAIRMVESSCGSSSAGGSCLAYVCADPDQVGYIIERRRRDTDGDWIPVGRVCVVPNGPVLTPGRILEEIRRVGLPSMSVQAPPETFVNYETVVYTKAATFARTVNLLGFTVDIEATPSQFRWNYDDGGTETTTSAGRPYPATDITHTWTDAHHTFHPSVDVTYQIRYRVNGSNWQPLGDTITAQGPEGDVRIREATGMLTDMR